MAADTHLTIALLCMVIAIKAEIYHEVRFVEMPQYSVALPGDSVYFSCATNLPAALEEITWLHRGQVLNGQEGFQIDKGQLTFQISNDPQVYKNQEGSYQCIGGASGSRYKIASIEAELDIAHLGDFEDLNKNPIEIFEGNDAVISCKVPESIPPAFVHFLKNDQDLDAAKVLNGDTLLLRNATLSMSGNYSCVVSNHITNQRKRSHPVILDVLASTKNEKSRMTYSPQDNYEVRVGEKLDVPCTASGVPTPDIIWSKMINGVFSLVNQTSTTGQGFLKFSSVSANDSGHYMCAVFNGGRRYVRRTTIIVIEPPQHVVMPDVYMHVPETGSISLPCQASGSPPPFIEWKFNGQPIDSISANVNRITGQLVIDNAVADVHTGFYQCFARNKAGQAVAQAFVQVGQDILRNDNGDETHSDYQDQDLLLETNFSDFQGHVVVQPTRPNVTQVNPESIIIQWELQKPKAPSVPLVPVKFFKIQFREFFKGKGRSDWRTVEEDIDPFNRAFELFGLHSDRKYRFRVIVVYENNDSQTSPLSRKFRLNAIADGSKDLLSPRPKPPAKSPQVLSVVPLGPTSLRLGWALDDSVNEEVEGYFIFYKPSLDDDQEKFKKVTIIGATSHSHIIEALIPGVEYAIKVVFVAAKMLPTRTYRSGISFSDSSIQSCRSFTFLQTGQADHQHLTARQRFGSG